MTIFEPLKNFLDSDKKLKKYPKKQTLKIISLFYIGSKFETGKEYTEKEVNEIIEQWHTFHDSAMIRRELYDRGFLDRHIDGRLYWVKEPKPCFEDFMSKQ